MTRTYAFSLDPERPWYGKLWQAIPGATHDHWRSGRVMAHMVNATALRQLPAAPKQRKRRLWPWLLALYGTPVALAISFVVALWLLRHVL